MCHHMVPAGWCSTAPTNLALGSEPDASWDGYWGDWGNSVHCPNGHHMVSFLACQDGVLGDITMTNGLMGICSDGTVTGKYLKGTALIRNANNNGWCSWSEPDRDSYGDTIQKVDFGGAPNNPFGLYSLRNACPVGHAACSAQVGLTVCCARAR